MFLQEITFFDGNLLFFTKNFVLSIYHYHYLLNIKITRLIALASKRIDFYVVVVAVFEPCLYLPMIVINKFDACQRLFRTRYSKIVV